MSNNFTLDDIRKAADKKYGSTEIGLGEGEVVVLLNPLRLPKEKRDVLGDIGSRLEEDGADQAAIMADALRAAAKSASKVEKLIEAIDGDLAILMELFERYTDGTQAGEASASES
jgi:hypothetical protein